MATAMMSSSSLMASSSRTTALGSSSSQHTAQRVAYRPPHMRVVAFGQPGPRRFVRRPGQTPKGCGPAGGVNFGANCGPSSFRSAGNWNDLFRELQNMSPYVEKWMESNGMWSEGAAAAASTGFSWPLPVDVQEDEDTYTFTADVPGLSKSDIKLQVSRERVLSISGERKAAEQTEEQKRRRRRTERRFGKFLRTFQLPEKADVNAISASTNNGVLTVSVRKVQRDEPDVTEIPINDDDQQVNWGNDNPDQPTTI